MPGDCTPALPLQPCERDFSSNGYVGSKQMASLLVGSSARTAPYLDSRAGAGCGSIRGSVLLSSIGTFFIYT